MGVKRMLKKSRHDSARKDTAILMIAKENQRLRRALNRANLIIMSEVLGGETQRQAFVLEVDAIVRGDNA